MSVPWWAMCTEDACSLWFYSQIVLSLSFQPVCREWSSNAMTGHGCRLRLYIYIYTCASSIWTVNRHRTNFRRILFGHRAIMHTHHLATLVVVMVNNTMKRHIAHYYQWKNNQNRTEPGKVTWWKIKSELNKYSFTKRNPVRFFFTPMIMARCAFLRCIGTPPGLK